MKGLEAGAGAEMRGEIKREREQGEGEGRGGNRGASGVWCAQGTNVCVREAQGTDVRVRVRASRQDHGAYKRSALHWASAFGLQGTLVKLLSLGADVAPTDAVRACYIRQDMTI